MNSYHVTENSTPVSKRDTKNLSVLESQPEHQVHSQSPNPDNMVSPLTHSGSDFLDNKDNEGSTPLGDKGSGSSSS